MSGKYCGMISGGKDLLAMKGLALALRATETPEFRRTFTPHRHFTGTSKIIYIYTYNLSNKNDRSFTR